MKKVLLVDDQYERWEGHLSRRFIKFGFSLIKTHNADDPHVALGIIQNHPEADIILLDGSFKDGNCMAVLHRLSENDIHKTICFSGDPKRWEPMLLPCGIKHFPRKHKDEWLEKLFSCMGGTCNC